MIQSEPENENGHSGILNSGLNGDRDDVFVRATESHGHEPTEEKSEPRKTHAGEPHLPSHQLEDVEVGPNSEDQDKEDEKEGHGFEDLDEELGDFGQVAGDEEADAERYDEAEGVSADLVIRNDDVGLVKDDAAERKDP